MATFQILEPAPPQYVIKVMFGEQEFIQNVVSDKTGQALTDHFQAYADEYEAAWVPALVPEPGAGEGE